MQQLSLFDFGEEAPKPEKKKKASKGSVEQSGIIQDNDNIPGLLKEDLASKGAAGLPSKEEGLIPAANFQFETEAIAKPESVQATDNDKEDSAVHQDGLSEEAEGRLAGSHDGQKDAASHEAPPITGAWDRATGDVTEQILLQNDTLDAHTEPLDTAKQDAPMRQMEPPVPSQMNQTPSETNGQAANDVVFANEQIGVKVVVKSVKTHTVLMPPAFTSNESEADQEQVPEALDEALMTSVASDLPVDSDTHLAPELESDLDTSFSPDGFQLTDDVALKPEQIEKVPGVPVSASSPTPMEPEVPAISSTPPAAGEVSEDELSDQEALKRKIGSDKNSVRKPFYIEDQTVPVNKRGRKSFKEIDAEVDLINIPPDEELFQKQYYPISVVAKWFRVNNSLLRFWENEFKILKPKKNKKGDRFFRPEDVKNLQLIYYLLRQKKLTINGAIKHLNSYKEQTEVNMQLIQTLTEFKGFLLELRAATEK